MERICSLNGCENYRGFAVGYCHKFKVIMNSQEKKEFFASLCADDMDAERLERAWQDEARAKTWAPES